MTTAPHPVDKYVGNRVRMRRIDIGMTQGQLADALGIGFQQIQKYEKGTNRISSSRLADISNVLKISVSWLFEGALENKDPTQAPIDPLIHDFITTRDGLRLAQNFPRIKDSDLRRSFINLVETVATHPVEHSTDAAASRRSDPDSSRSRRG